MRQIHDDDAVGEFVLEQRERILRTVGASVSIQPGNILATSWVRMQLINTATSALPPEAELSA